MDYGSQMGKYGRAAGHDTLRISKILVITLVH